jgi:hypothetical protein
VQALVQVAREHGENRIVGEPFKKFADVGDPEGSLKAGANFLQAFGKAQEWLPDGAMRFLTSSAESPTTRMTFVRLVSPEAMVTEDRGTFKSFAKNSMHAALALPSIGGAVREIITVSPSSPVMAFFFARG